MNKANLSIFLIFGLPLIGQYIWLASGNTGLSRDQMWGYSPVQFRMFSIFSIFVSFVVGLYLFYYLVWKWKSTKEWIVMFGLTLLVGASNFWIPSMIADNRIGNWLTLMVVAIGSLFVLSGIITDSNKTDSATKQIAIFSASWLLFQTLIMDFTFWNMYNNKFIG